MPRVSDQERKAFRQFLETIDDGSLLADEWTDSLYTIDSTLDAGSGVTDSLSIGLAAPNLVNPDAPFVYIGGSSIGTILMRRRDDPSICLVSFTSFWTIGDAKKIAADLISAITDAEAMEVANKAG